MKKYIYFTLTISIVLINYNVQSQVSISNNGNEPNSSAMLDVQSTNKGLLLPRMTTYDINFISNPATGLLVFNTDSLEFYFFDGTNWVGLYNRNDTIPGPWSCGLQFQYEGQSYNTVLIGTQCWMAENLNVGERIDGTQNQTNNDTIEKYCYNDEPDSCSRYGGLYQWDEMMQYDSIEGERGICPPDWHIPTDDEWTTLTDSIGGIEIAGGEMKTIGTIEAGTGLWYHPNTGATNNSGFSGLPGGLRSRINGTFNSHGSYGYWWSSSEHSDNFVWYRHIFYNSDDATRSYAYRNWGFSIRCIKD